MACQHGYAWDRITTLLIRMREREDISNERTINVPRWGVHDGGSILCIHALLNSKGAGMWPTSHRFL